MTIALFSRVVLIERFVYFISQNTQTKGFIYPNIQNFFENFSGNHMAIIWLSYGTKITITTFRNKKLVSDIFVFLHFYLDFFISFFRKIKCSLIPFQRYQICTNWKSNIDMVNKKKKCGTKFWPDF